MSKTYLRAGLTIKTTKTEILSTSSPDAPTFSISGNQLKNSANSTYLGQNLSFTGDVTNEFQRRIKLASSAFGHLSKHVFGNQNHTIHTKIAVYNAVVISTILYGHETWVPYRCHIRLLESFHTRRRQLILGLCWWYKVTHSEIRSRAGIPTIESMLLHHQLRWLSHIIRMPDSRLPHRVLYGKLRLGHRSAGGQKKRFKDHIKSILKRCYIPFNRLEVHASNRATWRSTCAPGISYFDDEYDRSAAVRYQCSAQLRILFINANFVADNASHALASSAQ